MLKYEQVADRYVGMRASEVLKMEREEILSILRPWLEDGSFTEPKLFGSVAKGTDTEMSDIDILLSKGRNYSAKRHFDLFGAFVDFGFPIQISIRDELYFTPDKMVDLC